MRPPRDDIAAPEFPPRLAWVGVPPESMAASRASGPVLVHFFDLAQLNSVRTLPYLRDWHLRYADHGLTVLGAHSPRFPFTADRDAVAAARDRLAIGWPVALDFDYRLWHDYGCRGWPSLFLWSEAGALDWFHFGEGEYGATEEAIRILLRSAEPLRELPDPVEPKRATDVPGARVAPPSEEVFPGGDASRPWSGAGEDLLIDYAAGGAHAAVDGEGELNVRLDDGPGRAIAVRGPELVELAAHPGHERHRLGLRGDGGVRLWSVAFAAGMPPPTG